MKYILLLVLGLLAACASLPVTPPTPTPRSPTTGAQITPPPLAGGARNPAVPRGGSEAVVVTPLPSPTPLPQPLILWAAAPEPELELLRQLAAEWSARSGRELRVESRSADAIRAGLLVIPADQAPALLWGDEQDLAGLAADGQLQPVGALPAGLLAAPVAGGQLDGAQLGFPVTARGALLLYYNRRLLPAPPATSDELIAVARQQTREGRFGLVYNWPDARWLVPWLAGFGGTLLAPDGTTPALVSPQMDSALSLLQELRTAGPPPPATYEQGVSLFQDGQAAMIIDGDWSFERYQGLPATLDLGIAPLPLVPATGRRAPATLGASYLMFQSGLAAADLPAAQDFAAQLVGPEAQRRFAELGQLPALQTALAEPAVQSSPLLSALAPSAPDMLAPPTTQAHRCAWQAINQALPPLLLEQQDRNTTMELMQQQSERCGAR